MKRKLLRDQDIRKLERITGLTLWLPEDDDYDFVVLIEGQQIPLLFQPIANPKLLIQVFLCWNLERLRLKIGAKQEWKCAHCGTVRPLQLHHKKKRSRQRDDREENLEMICQQDHAREHG